MSTTNNTASATHVHAHRSSNLDGICSCGAEICSSLDPNETTGCTLTKGHSGSHFNGWKPELGTWENPTPFEPDSTDRIEDSST